MNLPHTYLSAAHSKIYLGIYIYIYKFTCTAQRIRTLQRSEGRQLFIIRNEKINIFHPFVEGEFVHFCSYYKDLYAYSRVGV